MSIRLENVHFSYNSTTVCRGLDWQLPEKGVVCLWGPSGCGKTTLLRLLAGLETPQKGRVTGVQNGVAMCFQEDRLLPWRSALENVTLATGGNEDAARRVLTRVGLSEYVDSHPASLSGGQNRRVALARALAAPGDVLLLDEPFTGLDEAAWRQIVPLIAERAEQCPVILVTHVMEEARALGAWTITLEGLPLTGTL